MLSIFLPRFDSDPLLCSRLIKAFLNNPKLSTLSGCTGDYEAHNRFNNINQSATDRSIPGIGESILYGTHLRLKKGTERESDHCMESTSISKYYRGIDDWQEVENQLNQVSKSFTFHEYGSNGQRFETLNGGPIDISQAKYTGKYMESFVGYLVGVDMQYLRNIYILDLSGNPNFGNRGLENLLESFCVSKPWSHTSIRVRRLRLTNIGLTDQSAPLICKLLHYLPTIEDLDVSDNHLNDTGVIMLVKGLLRLQNDKKYETGVLTCLSLRNVGMSGTLMGESEEVEFATELAVAEGADDEQCILREFRDYETTMKFCNNLVQFWLLMLIHYRQWPDFKDFKLGDDLKSCSTKILSEPEKKQRLEEKSLWFQAREEKNEFAEGFDASIWSKVWDYNVVRTAALQMVDSQCGIGLKSLDISLNNFGCNILSDLVWLVMNTQRAEWLRALAPTKEDIYTFDNDGTLRKSDNIERPKGSLMSLNLSDTGMEKISPYIYAVAITDAFSGTAGMETVQYLDLSYNCPCGKRDDQSFDPSGFQFLIDALKMSPTLTSLNLRGSDIGARSMKSLFRCLKTDTFPIQTLLLDGTHCSEEGGKHIGEVLGSLTHLKYLSLASCAIGPIGGAAIYQGMVQNSSIKHLDLSSNCLAGYNDYCRDRLDGLLEMIARNHTLTSLNLAENELFGLSRERVPTKAISSSHNVLMRLATAIEENAAAKGLLTHLDITNNRICPIDGIKKSTGACYCKNCSETWENNYRTCKDCIDEDAATKGAICYQVIRLRNATESHPHLKTLFGIRPAQTRFIASTTVCNSGTCSPGCSVITVFSTLILFRS